MKQTYTRMIFLVLGVAMFYASAYLAHQAADSWHKIADVLMVSLIAVFSTATAIVPEVLPEWFNKDEGGI